MQEREGTSLESQIERCRAYANERGWMIERIEQEQGSGGDIDRRDKLKSLLSAARAGHLDAILCYHIDRLSRDTDDLGWLRRELRIAGVDLVFVTGTQDPIYQAVEGAMGQNERRQIKERTKRGKESKAKSGCYLPGHAPYGYRHRRALVGRSEKVVGLDPDLVTAPILQEIFDFISKGGSITGCARWLNSKGIPHREVSGGDRPPSRLFFRIRSTKASPTHFGTSPHKMSGLGNGR